MKIQPNTATVPKIHHNARADLNKTVTIIALCQVPQIVQSRTQGTEEQHGKEQAICRAERGVSHIANIFSVVG